MCPSEPGLYCSCSGRAEPHLLKAPSIKKQKFIDF